MLNDLMERVGGSRRVMIAGVGLGASLMILMISRVASAPTMVPAISNVAIENTTTLTDRLDGASIKYTLAKGGSEILVASEDLAKARVTLAKDGMPGGGRPGLEIFDRPTWGWNDFTQRVNYRRALEGELERTIGRMKGITRAEVHIAITEQGAFRRPDDRPSTASVLLATERSTTPGQDVVQGIQHLVSSSVDGLAMENVSVHDETGRQWSESNDGSITGLSSKQLRQQQDFEKYLEKKAEDLVTQMVGPNNARVQISASLNFDRLERTTHSVDPEKQALTTETKSEIVPGAQGGAASTNIANAYDNSKTTEVFSSAIGGIRRLTVAVLVNDRVAGDSLAQGAPPRSTAELQRIEMLVRTAVGVDSSRGDAVSVVSLPFEQAKVAVVPEPKPTALQKYEPFIRPAGLVLGVLVAFILALVTMRSLKQPLPAAQVAQPALGIGGTQVQLPPAAAAAVAAMPPRQPRLEITPADTEVRDKVVETVTKDPEAAVRLVKSWIKES
jgi:flagellar M-ring protein FliF